MRTELLPADGDSLGIVVPNESVEGKDAYGNRGGNLPQNAIDAFRVNAYSVQKDTDCAGKGDDSSLVSRYEIHFGSPLLSAAESMTHLVR